MTNNEKLKKLLDKGYTLRELADEIQMTQYHLECILQGFSTGSRIMTDMLDDLLTFL